MAEGVLGGGGSRRREQRQRAQGSAAGTAREAGDSVPPRAAPRPPTPVEIIAAAAHPRGSADPVAVIAAAAGVSAGGQSALPSADFWQLWTAHQGYLRKQTLRLMSGNLADAEDALSNAMLKALQKFETYAGAIVNERAWLTRLVHNVCMDLHRSNRRIRHSLEEVLGGDFEAADTMPETVSPTPEEETIARRELGQLSAELERMPRSLSEPLLMRVLDDLSYDEIAARLGLSNCAVRKRIQLARDRLRKLGIR